MSSSLAYSDFNISQNNKKPKNQTLRRKRKKDTNKAKKFLNSLNLMKKQEEPIKHKDTSEDESELANFTPEEFPPHPKLSSKINTVQPKPYSPEDLEKEDIAVTAENFKVLGDQANIDYYKKFITPQMSTYAQQYTPSAYANLQNQNFADNSSGLMKKLNYMIHLLEEQQDEKTENVTEELILYLFLGVFVIFVVDSFARAAKYTR